MGGTGGKLNENLARNVIFSCADKQNAQSARIELKNLAECPVIGQKNDEKFLGFRSREVARRDQYSTKLKQELSMN